MGLFSRIMDKLLHHAPAGASNQPGQAGSAPGQQQTQYAPSQPGQQGAGQNALQRVDVEAVLVQIASKKGGGGNYRTSIVDLLKLLDLDSDLAARKELAEELNVHAGDHGSAEQNVALHKAVMRKLAENGGKVPDSLKN
jgi:hypothetical protein